MGLRRFSLRPSSARTAQTSRGWEPVPSLAAYADDAIYDLTMVADLLGVRRMTLWAWVQQLRIPHREMTSSASARPSFSERDLVALLWLRDQILGGVSPFEAAARLIPELYASRVRAFAERPRGTSAPSLPVGSQPGSFDAPPDAPAAPLPNARARTTAPLALYPVGAPITPPPWVASVARPEARMTPAPTFDLAALASEMAQAFAALDASLATSLVEQALAVYPVERVCTELLLPVLARVEQLSGHREIPLAETLFARNYLRALFFAHFASAIERPDGPLVFLGCGPKEEDEVPALVLGLFWRRLGLRVIYLGADVDVSALVGQFDTHRPALLALTVSHAQRVRTLSRLARDVAEVAGPAVLFGYYGHVFVHNRELQARVGALGGIYLGDDPAEATRLVRQRLPQSGSAPDR